MSEKNPAPQETETLAESFARLESLLAVLENRDTTLEEAFAAYRQGMELVLQCNAKIDQVEKKMKVIDKEGELHEFS